jgi:hypothetical protein
MTYKTREEAFCVDNVTTFQGYDVHNGEVTLSEDEYKEILNEMYGEVTVCGQTFQQGDLLEDADPTAFRCGKNDYESALQTELETQLDREDDSQIEFEIDPDDIEEDESDDE